MTEKKGVSLRTFWTETKYAFKSYINKNRKSRKKERENFEWMMKNVLNFFRK